jgi:NAD(P)-dependent dehydrogenase (short-subunit alcohol dehydrogenase family)
MSKQVVLITGAGRGIGRAVAVEMARRGWSLALVARTEQELQETAELCGGGLVLPGDVADPAVARDSVKRTIERFGRLDALVNNAGFASMQPIEQTSDLVWRTTIDTNLTATMLFCREAWVHLERTRGAIVNVSSEATRDPLPGFTAYAAAKAGVNGLSLALAREGAVDGIRVHTVSPGSSETAMFRSLVSEQQWPRDKTLDPADVACVIVDCIDGPLRHTSGEIIYLKR